MLDAQLTCEHCELTINKNDLFCGNCGKEVKKISAPLQEDVFDTIKPTLLYYFITLLLLATYKFTNLFPSGLEGMVIISILDILVVVAFWIHNYDELSKLFRLSNVRFKIMGLTILGAILGSIIVSVVANWINLSIQDDVFYDMYLFEDTLYPFLFAVLFIAVQPAIFEEVAFRGFMFNNLEKITSGMSAVYVTAFVFGLMHLQIISLLWLIPIGLVFGFLRYRYNSIWYGVMGHFTYNFSITIFEFMNWF